MPLQLVTVASLAADLGWEVEIQDEILEELRFSGDVDLVGVSIKACTAGRGFEIARRYRERGVPVVIGGAHASLAPELAAPHADAVLVGGAEGILGALLADASARRLRPVYRTEPGGGSVLPPYRLRWDLVSHLPYRVYSVVARRGCPQRCSFCSIPGQYGFEVKTRRIEDVLADAAGMPRSHFLLWDENPTADPHYASVLFNALVPLRKVWFGEAPTTVVQDARLLALMARSGCRGLYVGIESFNQAGLNKASKGFNRVASYRDMVRRLNDVGIAAHAGVVFGFEGDDASIFDRTYEGLYACGFNSASFKILTPYPGTALGASLRAAGRIIDENLEHYDENHVVFLPSSMTPEALEEGFRQVTLEFYSAPGVLRRIWKAARRSGPLNYYPMLANLGWRKAYLHDLRA